MRVKEESERASLRLNIKKPKIMAPAHYCMANRRGNGGNSDRFSLLGLQITAEGVSSMTLILASQVNED